MSPASSDVCLYTCIDLWFRQHEKHNYRSDETWHPCFTARRYASAVYAVVVCLYVCLSHAVIVSKWLNLGSRKQRHTIAKGL